MPPGQRGPVQVKITDGGRRGKPGKPGKRFQLGGVACVATRRQRRGDVGGVGKLLDLSPSSLGRALPRRPAAAGATLSPPAAGCGRWHRSRDQGDVTAGPWRPTCRPCTHNSAASSGVIGPSSVFASPRAEARRVLSAFRASTRSYRMSCARCCRRAGLSGLLPMAFVPGAAPTMRCGG